MIELYLKTEIIKFSTAQFCAIRIPNSQKYPNEIRLSYPTKFVYSNGF